MTDAAAPIDPNRRFDLSGRVAIVTGGSRGIGRAIALGFAGVGAKVVIASRKQEACEAPSVPPSSWRAMRRAT